MEAIKTAHSVYSLQYHVVLVCKYRRRILNPGVCSYFKKILAKLQGSTPVVVIEEVGFDKDHVHMVMVIPPNIVLAQ